MYKNVPAIALAFFITAQAALPSSVKADNVQNGMHGWDEPRNAEFIQRDVSTKFLYPRVHWRERDVHVDCDLLVKDGNKALATTGFAAQFNAETQLTIDNLSSQSLSALQNWQGEMDYRAGRVRGTLTHLDSQHGIGLDVVKRAILTCKRNYSGHGININNLATHLSR